MKDKKNLLQVEVKYYNKDYNKYITARTKATYEEVLKAEKEVKKDVKIKILDDNETFPLPPTVEDVKANFDNLQNVQTKLDKIRIALWKAQVQKANDDVIRGLFKNQADGITITSNIADFKIKPEYREQKQTKQKEVKQKRDNKLEENIEKMLSKLQSNYKKKKNKALRAYKKDHNLFKSSGGGSSGIPPVDKESKSFSKSNKRPKGKKSNVLKALSFAGLHITRKYLEELQQAYFLTTGTGKGGFGKIMKDVLKTNTSLFTSPGEILKEHNAWLEKRVKYSADFINEGFDTMAWFGGGSGLSLRQNYERFKSYSKAMNMSREEQQYYAQQMPFYNLYLADQEQTTPETIIGTGKNMIELLKPVAEFLVGATVGKYFFKTGENTISNGKKTIIIDNKSSYVRNINRVSVSNE